MPKIYFCTSDYLIADTLELMDNTVYETTLDEFLKLIKKIFDKPMEYIDTEFGQDVPLNFSTDKEKILKICTALFVPFEDTFPETGRKALDKEMNQEKEEEGAENIIKVA